VQECTRQTARSNTRLSSLPQETILFDRSRLKRSIDIALAASGSLIMAEAVVFGRAATGETMNEGCFTDRWRVRRTGKLVFADSVRLDGRIADRLGRPAVAAGGNAIATALIAPCHDGAVDAVRGLEERFAGEVGVSAWNGIALVRFCARDGAALRRDLIVVLAALNAKVLRLWLQ
jgi:urease accessory protein